MRSAGHLANLLGFALNTLRKLKSVLSSLGKSESPFDRGTGEFNPIDIDSVKSYLRLAKRAVEDGKNNIPSISAKRKDAVATT